jgi:hypothetical protein
MASGDWIGPLQAGKPHKVRVGGMELSLMLDRQRRQVCVGGQITRGPDTLQKPEENFRMTIARMRDADVWLPQPGACMRASDRRCQGMRHDLSIRREPDEPEDRGPRQTDGLRTVQQAFPPGPGGCVSRRLRVVGMDQQIDVGHDHGRSFRAASSVSSSSAS